MRDQSDASNYVSLISLAATVIIDIPNIVKITPQNGDHENRRCEEWDSIVPPVSTRQNVSDFSFREHFFKISYRPSESLPELRVRLPQ